MTEPEQSAPREDDETGVAAGAPGPSGTGEGTDAGADPSAPSDDRSSGQQ